ncbi:uncharacterized protein LOC116969289 [Amblyraja radiata]|uniref:uncharacterized protein LOC116969289 n=1 Tax=Amblyraja radiata TaxID=386614 RepID=UPI0014029770|nr:uncharacterized protein LOC116969289 [Amblyraja radiata]
MQTCRPSACESSRTQLICKPSPPLVLLSKDRMYRAVQLVIVLFVPTKITRGVDTEIASADGDSVMFPGVGADRRRGVAVFQWKKAGGTAGKGSAMKPVLQLHSGSREPAVIRSYAGRLTFFPHNGSMAFHNLTQQDAGLYQLYINLQKDAIQSVRLTVMDRLSEVSMWSNSSSLGSAVQLSCAVVGNPHEYQWRKDGGDISRHHQLMNGNMNLIIPRASSIDCGTYTCIASNPVSSAQKNLTLTIYGVPAEQIVVMMVWASGLLYSGLSLIGSTFLCAYKCAPITESRKILFHLLTWLSSWNTPSLVIIHIALLPWIVIKGTFTVITGSLYIVSALFLTMIALMTIPKLQHPSVLNVVELTGFKILLEFSQTIVIPTSIIELKETFGQMNQGCHSRYLSWGTFLAVTAVGAMVFSLYIVARHRKYPSHQSIQWFKRQERFIAIYP